MCLLSAACLWADGHGPAFGYATTTLGAGDTSVETALMWRSGVAMIAPLVSYGATENLQFSVSAPFHLNHGDHPVGRFTAEMPGNPEAEVLAAWRFHHKLTGVGTRNESTLYMGASESTQLPPRADGPPLSRATGLYIAGATGHISRRYYIWGGAGYQRYSSRGNDHQSNSFLSSLVVGWRPWERDYPKPDLRFFWETTGEHIGSAWRRDIAAETGPGHHDSSSPLPAADASGIIVLPDSGGSAVFSGPTFLCTYRNIAFQSGVLFAVWRKPNGIQPPETFRAVVGVSYFFLGGRK